MLPLHYLLDNLHDHGVEIWFSNICPLIYERMITLDYHNFEGFKKDTNAVILDMI